MKGVLVPLVCICSFFFFFSSLVFFLALGFLFCFSFSARPLSSSVSDVLQCSVGRSMGRVFPLALMLWLWVASSLAPGESGAHMEREYEMGPRFVAGGRKMLDACPLSRRNAEKLLHLLRQLIVVDRDVDCFGSARGRRGGYGASSPHAR